MTRAEVVPDLLPRIAAASSYVRDAEDARAVGIISRNALIVQAVDAGISQREVARAAGLGRSRIVGILLADGAVDELALNPAPDYDEAGR